MKRFIYCALALLQLTASTVRADMPAPPVPLFTTSEGGHYVFKMVPWKYRAEGDKLVIERETYGVACSMDRDGNLVELWRTEGWFAWKVYLSEDGRYLVRIGPWAEDQEKHTDLAIAFYDRGKLLKEYRVRDLLKKPEFLTYSVSHYDWMPSVQSEPNGFRGGTFRLVMIDKTEYSFAFDTGQILLSRVDPGAKGFYEIRREEEKTAEKNWKAMYEKWTARASFDRHFKVSRIAAWNGITSGLWFIGGEWSAELSPLKEYDYPCYASAIFKIGEDKSIEVTITPQEIDAAFSVAMTHPYILERFDDDASAIGLYVSADRLHWNTKELAQWLEKCGIAKPKEDELRHWACFNINSTDRGYQIVYLNRSTGQLMYEDTATEPPYMKVLLDAKGKRITPDAAGASR